MRIQKHLQRFADRHGLQVERYVIRGPRGKIFEAFGRLFYSQPDSGYHEFNRITQAQEAIETIGLLYTAPVEPVKEARRALLIARREKKEMTIGEFALTYGFKARKYFILPIFRRVDAKRKVAGDGGTSAKVKTAR